ncbi:uncharacterized protein LOC129803439 isoform X2 [Phlebotomus papatasi]|uniref:uncharacterized protein LOC129803439 isoform X2 n=1 Tax=Phlebotomus papatasi TaxID=29031 RepID=UPI0024846B63|nr:uncharacterized protein LOC129803439 isoform X2 [Phlebotomus papatasi]
MDTMLYESAMLYDSMFEKATEMELEPCPFCGRTFVPSTLEKHVTICEKTATKKRKQFDSSRQRLEGTELATYLPKSYGLTNGRDSRVSPPKTNTLRRGSHMRSPSIERRSSTQSLNSVGKESNIGTSGRKRAIAPPQAEKCPHCERTFGMRAYDRHVEWCGEKAKLLDKSTSPTVSAAKERLNARINYKAPSLKTKRGMNREKYSPGFDDCYSECGTMTPNSIVSCNPRIDFGRKNSTNSMTSSITSESGFSDKYDPFVSAKRQLEELFSPSQPTKPVPTTRKSPGKSLHTNGSKPNNLTSPTSQLNQLKTSNFRRTSSLRMPKKTSPPKTFYQSRPSVSKIQRGISDEGPISSNFVKPEEYDEMPVRSVYATDFAGKKSPAQTPTSLTSRRNLRLDLKKTNLPSSDFPIAKTDSLAVFLNYERDLNAAPSMSEKELKDKSNSLRSQQKTPSDSPEVAEMQIRPSRLAPLDKPPKLTPITLDQILKPHEKIDGGTFIDPKLINLCDNLTVNVGKLSSDSSETVSSSGSHETMKSPTKIPDNRITSNNQRNTCPEKNRTHLRRQVKLDRNNFLFDMAPKSAPVDAPSDPYSDAYDQTIELIDADTRKIPANFDEIFNDFDFDEFLTSFEDDDQFPIFRDYKELMLNRQRRGRDKTADDNSLHRSPPECRNKSDVEDERVIKSEEKNIPTPPKEVQQEAAEATEEDVSSPEVPSPMEPIDTNYAEKAKSATTPKQRDSFEEAEHQLLQSVRELDLMCSSEDDPKTSTPNTPLQESPKMCKFCHECGSRFLVDTAKFCMECGVKRIVM